MKIYCNYPNVYSGGGNSDVEKPEGSVCDIDDVVESGSSCVVLISIPVGSADDDGLKILY